MMTLKEYYELAKKDWASIEPDYKGLEQRIKTISFDTIHDGTGADVVDCKNFNFLTILTNGGINPANNWQIETSGNSELAIVFNDLERYDIIKEVNNLPLINKKSFRILNQLGLGQGATQGLETGYMTLFFILTKFPYHNLSMKKNNPHVVLSGTVPFGTAFEYWFGVDRLNAGYNLAIPFIPKGYRLIHTCIYEEHEDLTHAFYYYSGSNICHSETIATGCQARSICAYRFRYRVGNNSADTDYDFNSTITLVSKSDNE